MTGGAGFIGSHLASRLLKEGWEVKILDNLSNCRSRSFGHRRSRRLGRAELYKGSILNRRLVDRAVADVDAVVHLAAIASVPFSVSNPDVTYRVNVEGTRLLLNQSVASGVNRFVLASSCAVYGEPLYVPTDELHPANPLSPYAESKLEAERACFKDSEWDGLEAVALRLFNVYGPGQADIGYASVISSFAKQLMSRLPLVVHGDGLQTRDFVHVSDVVEAIWLALNAAEAEGVFNIASGKPVAISELARMMAELAGVRSSLVFEEPREGDVRRSQGDCTRARTMLGYSPEVELEDGLDGLLRGADTTSESRVIEEASVL
ncbi:MAG: NAD-dependent epimerase/dehydratase family protein [Candidatus Bathyarchaeia archaeon]